MGCGDPQMFTQADGELAVRLARAVIMKKLGVTDIEFPEVPGKFREECGVFVTLNTFPGKDLRGCIGYSEPIMPLGKAIMDVAVAAALRDPRFPPVRPEEMSAIVIDVTLLTPPCDITYMDEEDLVRQIVIGRDGLIARKGFHSGLLLPQVPVEYGWSIEELLYHTCMKAGLNPDEWRRGDVHFQKFQGKVFGEETPGGSVVEIPLS
ncbi:MAG: TIGR00296 family protein [Candidatus Thermoplasmatota archaeon]|nr:TIGR00296 family protein [Candidatus Thermoplasmatota archaeon]